MSFFFLSFLLWILQLICPQLLIWESKRARTRSPQINCLNQMKVKKIQQHKHNKHSFTLLSEFLPEIISLPSLLLQFQIMKDGGTGLWILRSLDPAPALLGRNPYHGAQTRSRCTDESTGPPNTEVTDSTAETRRAAAMFPATMLFVMILNIIQCFARVSHDFCCLCFFNGNATIWNKVALFCIYVIVFIFQQCKKDQIWYLYILHKQVQLNCLISFSYKIRFEYKLSDCDTKLNREECLICCGPHIYTETLKCFQDVRGLLLIIPAMILASISPL